VQSLYQVADLLWDGQLVETRSAADPLPS
jgi:hypothetical protein